MRLTDDDLDLGQRLASRLERLRREDGRTESGDPAKVDLLVACGLAARDLAEWLARAEATTGCPEDVRTHRWTHLLVDGELRSLRVEDPTHVDMRFLCH